MNVKATLDLLMLRLGGRTSPELRANCLLEMQLFQENELEGGESLPWFLVTEQTTTTTTPNERRVALPPDFIREAESKNLVLVEADGNEIELTKKTYEELEKWDDDDTVIYTILGPYIILRPTPTAVLTIRYPAYYARQDTPVDSASSENGWFKWAADVMLSGAGLVVATLHLKDPELVTVMAGLFERAQRRLRNVETARTEANLNRRMG